MWNWTEDQVTLALIRHGETKANREHRYLGRTEEGLCEEGRKALALLKEKCGYPEVEYLFVSPMLRCRETAEILYPTLYPVSVPEWTEMDFGEFEYRNYEELKENVQYQAWIDSNGVLPFPNGESREAFVFRCETGFVKMGRMLEQMETGKGKRPVTVGAVVHGGTIMALLSRFHGGDYFDYQVPNGKGYLCKVKGRKDSVCLTKLQKL